MPGNDKLITLDNLGTFKDNVEKEIDASHLISVTYSEFVTAIINSTLIPGVHYRITDFVTKINGVYDLSILGDEYQGMHLPYATSAEHPFDLIVLATGANTYNENVKAIQHEGDTYFEHSNLAQWEVKWTHKNDRSQYSFADDVNGKGVIIYLKDEFDNSAFFDFKNVMNLQFALKRVDNTIDTGASFEYSDSSDPNPQPNRYGGLLDVFNVLQGGSIGRNLEFACPSLSGTSAIKLIIVISDVSKTTLDSTMDWTYMLNVLSLMMSTTVTLAMLAQLLGTTEEALQTMTERQAISTLFGGDFYYTFDYLKSGEQVHMDCTVFSFADFSNHIGKCVDALTSYISEGDHYVIPNGLPSVTFENTSVITNNYANEFGTNCHLNVFGSGCNSNKFGDSSYGSKFGNYCRSNTLGDFCTFIHMSDDCNYNSFCGYCGGDYFGEGCSSNSFGYRCTDIFLDDSCDNNSFGNWCSENSLIGDCDKISFGNACIWNKATRISTAIFEDGIKYVQLSSATGTTSLSNVKVCLGVGGTQENPLVLTPSQTPVEYKATGLTEVILDSNS